VLGELRGLSVAESEKIIELFLYYGVLGLKQKDGEPTIYIYDTQYDMEILSALVRKAGGAALYNINPALRPILMIKAAEKERQQQLSL
jgi:hypothetical protein